MSHGRPRTHKTHHGPDLREVNTFPHIVYFAPLQMGVSKSPRLGVLQLCGTITFGANLRSQQGLNQSCSPRRDLSNDMSHATCTQRNWVDSQLPVVGSQIASLTIDFSFGHNLRCRCPNGSCKPILDIYTSIDFQ
jgi:hypothetical protein